MKLSDTAPLFVPGFGNSEPDHWQNRWLGKLNHARRVEPIDWEKAERASWLPPLLHAVAAAEKPILLIGHSLGAATIIHAAAAFNRPIAGAFLVAPADTDQPDLLGAHAAAHDFGALPREKLAFPTTLIASRNDPYCRYEKAEAFANHWGANLIDAGEAGSINGASGHGPWPEGLLRLAAFLKTLDK